MENDEMEGEMDSDDEEVKKEDNNKDMETGDKEEMVVEEDKEEKHGANPSLDKMLIQSSEVESALTSLKSQIQSQLAGNSQVKEEQPEGWQSVDSLPAGWKYRSADFI